MMEQVKPQQSFSSLSPVLVIVGAEFGCKQPNEQKRQREKLPNLHVWIHQLTYLL